MTNNIPVAPRCPLAAGQRVMQSTSVPEDLKAAKKTLFEVLVKAPMNSYLASFVGTLENYFKKQTDGVTLVKIEFAFTNWWTEAVLPAEKSLGKDSQWLQHRHGTFSGRFYVKASMGEEFRQVIVEPFTGVIKNGRHVRWKNSKPKLNVLYDATVAAFAQEEVK